MPECVMISRGTLIIKVQGNYFRYIQMFIVTACNIVCQTSPIATITCLGRTKAVSIASNLFSFS